MSEPTKAVFLSYASQDSEAVDQIAQALRATGAEVWFDKNELVGGDAWDAKIRKQIAECALFVPVISANTQARDEGYFRLEWKLAVDRSHLIAHDKAFLLPVVIDATPDAAARVPPEFKHVQWTRLGQASGGQAHSTGADPALEKFCARVKQLLVAGVADPGPASAEPAATRRGDVVAPTQSSSARRWLVPATLGAVALVALALWRPWTEKPKSSPPPAQAPSASAPRPLTEAQKLTQQARALIDDDPLELRESFFLADELAQRAVAADPTDGTAWAVAARASLELLLRRYESTPRRTELVRQQVDRALSLAPDSVETGLAQVRYLRLNDRMGEAEKLLKQLAERTPGDERLWVGLSALYFGLNRFDDSLAAARRAQALPGGSGRAASNEANLLISQFRYREAKELLEKNLVGSPSRGDYQRYLLLLGFYICDLPAAKAFVARIPTRLAQEEAFISTITELWLRLGDGDRALAELKRMPREIFEDGWDWRPKGYLAGYAHHIAGRPAAAQAEWRHALAVVEQRLQTEPNRSELLYWKSLLQALTGNATAGRETFRLKRELFPNPDYWFDAIAFVTFGDREEAISLMLAGWKKYSPQDRSDPYGDFLYAPWFATIRDDPRIQALVAEQKAALEQALRPTAATPAEPSAPTQKSVAVLAFENHSDDRANEFFSDGIADELLSTLQKIPGLKVAAHTSAWSFKGKNATTQEIGEKLGVAHVVEGSVQKSGKRVKITARLSKAATNEEIWSKSFGPLELTDVFATQSELAQAIVAELRGRFGDGAAKSEIQAQVQAAEKGGTKNAEAHQLYLQGKFFASQFADEKLRQAETFLQRAVELDPQFALAWAALARESTSRAGNAPTRAEFEAGMALARRAADRALALEPNLAAAHLARFSVQLYNCEWHEATVSVGRAAALAPGAAEVLDAEAVLAECSAQTEKAVELFGQAVELDPVNARVRVRHALALANLKRMEEATAEFRRAIELSPSVLLGHGGVSLALVAQGRFDEAAAEAAREDTEWSRLFALAVAQWGQKRKPDADATLGQLIKSYAEVSAFQIAQVYAFRRENDSAFEWLERGYRQRDTGLARSKPDLLLESLHADPRWPVFLKKIGLSNEQLK